MLQPSAEREPLVLNLTVMLRLRLKMVATVAEVPQRLRLLGSRSMKRSLSSVHGPTMLYGSRKIFTLLPDGACEHNSIKNSCNNNSYNYNYKYKYNYNCNYNYKPLFQTVPVGREVSTTAFQRRGLGF